MASIEKVVTAFTKLSSQCGMNSINEQPHYRRQSLFDYLTYSFPYYSLMLNLKAQMAN